MFHVNSIVLRPTNTYARTRMQTHSYAHAPTYLHVFFPLENPTKSSCCNLEKTFKITHKNKNFTIRIHLFAKLGNKGKDRYKLLWENKHLQIGKFRLRLTKFHLKIILEMIWWRNTYDNFEGLISKHI